MGVLQTTYDYIVVGGGSSGCVVASRLSRAASVLLLEKGPSDAGLQDDRAVSSGSVVKAIRNPDVSRIYATVEQAGLMKRRVPIHRGILLGGCSSINGMLYVRGNRLDYDGWAREGNDGWAYDDVLPLFRRSEAFRDSGEVEAFYHGIDGELEVMPVPSPSRAALAFVEAARAAGFPDSRQGFDFNGALQTDAAGFYQVTLSAAGDRADAKCFLGSARMQERDSPGLTIETTTEVTRITLEGSTATGIECISEGGIRSYRASQEVIVCAGAFESPRLLMQSGIGPAEHLRENGIPVLADLQGVGQNLQDHLMTILCFPTKTGVGGSRFLAEAGLFVRTGLQSGQPAAPDLQFHALAGLQGLLPLAAEGYFILAPTLCKPLSRGSVRLAPPGLQRDLLIDPAYLERDTDVEVLRRGLELACEIASTSPLVELRAADAAFSPSGAGDNLVLRALPPASDETAAREFIRRQATTVWHPVGTCRMGRDARAVVDPELKVYGFERLRIADASIMPAIPSGNTNAACIMIGEKAADLVAGTAATGAYRSLGA
jgi:choline dehydrogenase